MRRARITRSATGLAVLAVLAVLLSVVATVGAPAAEAGADDVARLDLIEQTAWVPENGTFTIDLQSSAPVDREGELRVQVRQAVASRAEFTVGLGDAGPGPLLDDLAIPAVLALDRSDAGSDTLSLELVTAATGPIPLTEPGVYPVVIEVDLDDGSTASLLTHLVRLPGEDQRPDLRVALIAPVGAQPVLRASGALRISPQESARFGRRIEPLAAEPDVPLTVVPVPETLESLSLTQRGRPVVQRLAGALDGRQVLSAPYVHLDVAEWVGEGLLEPLDRQLAAGEDVIEETLGTPPDRGTRYVSDRPDAAALRELSEEGADRIVVPSGTIPGDRRPADGAPLLGPVVLATPDAQIAAAVTDPLLQAHADSTGDQVLDAHRTLADLATIAFDRPLAPSGSVLALSDRGRLATGYVSTLLRHLDGGPLRPVTVDDWFAEVAPTPAAASGGAPGQTLTLPVAERELDGLGRYPADLGVAEVTLQGLASLTDGNDPRLTDLRRRLLTSGSDGLTGGQRAAYLSAVGGVIREQTDRISSPEGQTVTLTARQGRVPVTLRNDTGVPARVVVEVSSDRLDFPEGSQIEVVLVGEATTIEVPVETRTTGSFQMEVTATSPDGVLVVAATAVKIRSTAVSGVGLALSIGAGIVLLTWWLRHWRDRRRDARLVPLEE